MTSNPPAFPLCVLDQPYHVSEGMSLRDYFAAQAIAQIPALLDAYETNRSLANIAEWSYRVADAMLAEREGKDHGKTRINGHQVPDPIRSAQEIHRGQYVYFPEFSAVDGVAWTIWSGDQHDRTLLASGVLHSSHDAAAVHAAALRSLTRNRKEVIA